MDAVRQVKIIKSRLAELESLDLRHGGHDRREAGMCAMEAAAFIAGRPHSDSPPCVSPVISAFMRRWNDSLHSDADRNRLLKPLLPDVIGTANGKDVEDRRAWMVVDWLVREFTPPWLRLAGLTVEADTLASVAELTDAASAEAAMRALQAAREKASAAGAAALAAARAAAWDAAGDAAWDAARDAARDAAWAAARAAARAAALAAARAAAWDAAWAAARDKLAPVVTELQASAQNLVRRLCAVHRVEPVME